MMQNVVFIILLNHIQTASLRDKLIQLYTVMNYIDLFVQFDCMAEYFPEN